MSKEKKKKKESKKTIRVEIIESKPNGFYIVDLDKINPDEITTKDLEYRINIITGTNKEDKLIKIDLELDAFLINSSNSNKQELFGIKSATIFRTPDFDKVINEDVKVLAPDDFTKKLLNICIGGIRGMLAVNLVNTELSHITIPLLDLSGLKELKPIED
ncbi:hypothetical protein [Algibacter sp. 2305UL17-15]|uniref:hypothetical protein n=1 Tax=Algibacter sp. 2305UL17-15 TaxID=3231268 RepID=UPI0034594906